MRGKILSFKAELSRKSQRYVSAKARDDMVIHSTKKLKIFAKNKLNSAK